MITFWGLLVSVMFVVCYMGQSVSSGMPPSRGRILMWGCWMLAALAMMVCYLATRVTVG